MYTFSIANPVAVKMVASIVGPADLTDPLYINTPLIQNVLTSLLGKSYNQDPALHRNASPVAQVKAGLPPVFMSYGEKDELVPLAQANALQNKLKQSGITTQLLLYPAEGHEFSKSAIDDTILKLASFYKNNVP
jgi:dipeptidyl aminopeptidase/acylaminoacyl peptidase